MGEVPLTREGGLYVDIYAGAAKFLVTSLMLGPLCLLEEPVCPCLAVFICCRVKIKYPEYVRGRVMAIDTDCQQGQTRPPDCLTLARWTGWSAGQVGRN